MGCLRESIGHRQPTKVAKDAGTVYSDKMHAASWQQKLSLPRFPKQTEEFFRAEKLDKTCCCSYARCNWSTQMKEVSSFGDLWQIKETLMLFWNPLNLPLADATKVVRGIGSLSALHWRTGTPQWDLCRGVLGRAGKEVRCAAQANGEMALGQNWVPQNGW